MYLKTPLVSSKIKFSVGTASGKSVRIFLGKFSPKHFKCSGISLKEYGVKCMEHTRAVIIKIFT